MTTPVRAAGNSGAAQVCITPGCGKLVARLHMYGAVHKRCIDCEDRIARFGDPERTKRRREREAKQRKRAG